MNFIGKTWSFEKSKFFPIFFLQAINVRKTRYTFFVVFFFLYWNIILFFFSFCSVELFFLILRTCNVGTIPFVTHVFLATNAGIDMQENHFQIFFIYTIYRVSQMYGTPWIFIWYLFYLNKTIHEFYCIPSSELSVHYCKVQ